MKHTQYLFFDIDGTLISSKTKQIPASAKEAIRLAQQKGNKVYINTGRTFSIQPKELFEEIKPDGFLCGCGTHLILDGKDFFYVRLDEEQTRQVISWALEYKVNPIYEGKDFMYFEDSCLQVPIIKRLYRFYPEQGFQVMLRKDAEQVEISKLCIFPDENSQTEPFLEKVRSFMDIIPREQGFYEIVLAGYSKATAIEKVLEHYHASVEDAWAFGDSSNDLPMFACVPNTVAMGDHDPVLEPYTKYIADTVEADGIYKILKKLDLMSAREPEGACSLLANGE